MTQRSKRLPSDGCCETRAYRASLLVLSLVAGACGGAGDSTEVVDQQSGGVSGGIVINEVESNGGVPGDWAELHNDGPAAVDLSGWIFRDNDDTHTYLIPSGTTLAPGA
jgi:hypothetical protein